eukprot:COSAG05_NODE_1352_length_5112_cov_27.256533_1_plen_129_part_00
MAMVGDHNRNCDVCHSSGCGRTRYRCTSGCDWDMCGKCREKGEGREKKNAVEAPKSAEQRLEATLSHWLSHFCCSIVSTCADYVHPGNQAQKRSLEPYNSALLMNPECLKVKVPESESGLWCRRRARG